jgi:hypothetical protein
VKSVPSYLAAALFIMACIMTDCNSAKRIAGRHLSRNTDAEDFDGFYDRFHTDSAFQMSRIKFPLEGMSVDGFERRKWTRENWYMMKVRIYDVDTSLYEVSYNLTEKEFVQKIWVEDSGFSSEYRFELIEGRWYLVYVLDQNL